LRLTRTAKETKDNATHLRGVLAVLIALAVLGSTAAIVSANTAAPAAALELAGSDSTGVLTPAPVGAFPVCESITGPLPDGCPQRNSFLTVSSQGSLGTFTSVQVQVNPSVPPCASYDAGTDVFTPSPCYSEVSMFVPLGFSFYNNISCVWLLDATDDPADCPALYRDPTSFVDLAMSQTIAGTTKSRCGDGGNFRTFVKGGPANVPGGPWIDRAGEALKCEVTFNGPAPDNLFASSWFYFDVYLTISESGTNNLGRWEIAEAVAPVNGFLGPDSPLLPDRPDPDDPPTVGPFTDVSADSFARDDIELLFDLGITTGTSATTYGPDELVTREQMAAFLARLWRSLGKTCPTDATPFSDVNPASFAKADIVCIFGLDITTGTSATTYDPGGRVTREQMAAFLARLWRSLGNSCPSGPSPFTDVSSASFAEADISCIFSLGITTGTSATRYSPGANVTREQMAAFLARTYRLQKGLA
jgi:S-layer family protein